MKKFGIGILMIGCLFLLTGCEEKKEPKKVISNGVEVNTKSMTHEHCTREGSVDNGEVSLNYDIYYTGEDLNILESEEKIISASDEVLDLYENAYKQIHAHYTELEYYDTEVVRGDTTVTSTITINYDKIDIAKLLEIEGEEDNIIENGKAKVKAWKTLAKKFGTTCEEVED